MKNIVMLRTNSCRPDPRVEKEANSIITLEECNLKIVCWDRDARYSKRQEHLELKNGKVPIVRFGIPATWGGGMKANFFPMLKFEWKLFWWLMFHHKEYDVIHACDLLTGLPAYVPCRLFKKKMVYDIFDYYADSQHGSEKILNIFRKLENHIINKADVTIICSEKREEQIAGTKPQKLVVLHNAPGQNQIYDCMDSDFPVQGKPENIKIVYVGNLVEDRFITKALASAEKLPNVEFHIGGFGVLEDQIKKMAEEQENVYFYGKMQYKDVLALENQCHIMLALYDPAVPNHKYAAPNKVYEAMALGKPLVMFHNTGMDDILKEYDVGAVCDATEEGLRSAFETLIAKSAEWDRMEKKLKQLFYESYSWDIMGERLCEIYRRISLQKR